MKQGIRVSTECKCGRNAQVDWCCKGNPDSIYYNPGQFNRVWKNRPICQGYDWEGDPSGRCPKA